MISLRKTFDKLDTQEQRFRTALDCYLAAIQAIRDHTVEICPELARELRSALSILHRALCEGVNNEGLENSRNTLTVFLRDYKDKSALLQTQKEEDLRAMLNMLGEAAETFMAHNHKHSLRLKIFAQQIQMVGRGTDISQMRKDLTKQVSDLRAVSNAMQEESHASATHLQEQLLDFQQRLQHAEQRAATDALTGLLNRGEGESRVREKLEAGVLLSIIMLDLNGFKQINDHWGHSAGDQVLKQFSRNLEKGVRPSDTVFRWGGDEFLIILDGDESTARNRAEQLRESLRSRYRITALAKTFDVDVSASLGVTQARAGETADSVVSRADADLYRNKGNHKSRFTGPISPELVRAG